MKLREYQAKAIFAERGIPVPRGEVAQTVDQAVRIAKEIGGPVVLKPQLGIKGRGKVGGIGFAEDAEGARAEAERLLGLEVRGELVRKLLVEQRVSIEKELYLAVTIDYAARRPVLMASTEGGVEIEEVARTSPDAILRIPGSILHPPTEQELAPVARRMGPEAAELLLKLYDLFVEHEAELVEVNPVAVTPHGPVAVDAVLNVNDSALFRRPKLQQLRTEIPEDDPLAAEAREQRWTYIDLGGEIAILSSGAGLTMTIVDLIARRGGTAANFLDTAQIDEQGIYRAFELLRRARPPRVWLVNIFAGLNRCDRLAEGIRDYLTEHPVDQPVVVRMVGNMEQEGHRILEGAGIAPVRELELAIERCVEICGASTEEGGAQ